MFACFSYIVATENGFEEFNFTNAMKVKRHVSFQDPPGVSISMEVTSQDSPDASISMKETEIPISGRDDYRPTIRKSSIISTSEIKLTYHKLAVVFGIFCIVMLFMLPIIFYYVDGNSNVSGIPPSRTIGIDNISQVCMCVYAYICKYVCILIKAQSRFLALAS